MGGPGWRGVIEEYRDFLPVTADSPVITLQEGATPLVPAPRLSERVGAEVWLKVEGANPTGSFKDRGMTLAISKAVEDGAKAVVCASTGNTSASAAAYSTRAGLTCAVLIPEGYIALGKLAQALIHGARVLQIRGNFDNAFELVKELGERMPVTIVNSINQYRIEGQKTAAFEIVDVLGDAPDAHCIPVGNAGNISAYWKGYLEYREAGLSTRLPAMMGFQAAGAAPIVLGHPVENPETDRHRHPDRQPGLVVRGHRGGVGVGRGDPRGHRRRHPRRLPVPGVDRGGVLRAGVGGVGGGTVEVRGAGGGCVGRVHADRPRPEGPRPGHRPDRGALARRRRHRARCGPSWGCSPPKPRTGDAQRRMARFCVTGSGGVSRSGRTASVVRRKPPLGGCGTGSGSVA